MTMTDFTDRPSGERFNRGRAQLPAPTDPYGTSLRLKKIIQPRSGEMTSADVEKAIKLVMEAPRSAVSVPVWNMLLGMIGREGRLELMWKTFNDVREPSLEGSSFFMRCHVLIVSIDEETKL